MKESRLRLDIRKIFFTIRVVRHWNRLLRHIMDGSSPEMCTARLDGSLSNLIWRKVSQLAAGELDLIELSWSLLT